MDPRLREFFKACFRGDFSLCINLIDANPDILLSTTPHKNNFLHIAAMLGHYEFAYQIWNQHCCYASDTPLIARSLFSGTNIDGETPLIAALMAANYSVASWILVNASKYLKHEDLEEGRSFNCMLLKVDRRKENVLHHALRNGFQEIALDLLFQEPQLSMQTSSTGESPMAMAAWRGNALIVDMLLNSSPKTESALPTVVRLDHAGSYSEVVEQLPEIPSSADCGTKNEAAMLAAVRFGQSVEKSIILASELTQCDSKYLFKVSQVHRCHQGRKFSCCI